MRWSRTSRVLGLGVALCLAAVVRAQVDEKQSTVLVDNPGGDVTVRIVPSSEANIEGSCETRALRAGDLQVTRRDGFFAVMVRPPDGAKIDVVATIPFNYRVQARTKTGAVTVEGPAKRAEVITDSGDVRLRVPLAATRIEMLSDEAPAEVRKPPRFRFAESVEVEDGGRKYWYFRDRLDTLHVTSSRVIVNAKSPGTLVVEDAPIPEEWPVKPPWMARALLDEILAGRKAIRRAGKWKPKEDRQEAEEQTGAEAETGESSGALTIEEGIPKFSSSVRMVTLNAAVYDAQGRPLLDLKREDFEVIENGKRQELEFAGSEEVPFNLALLLDMSGSTRRDREAMKTAAKRFVDVARPQDKTAAYALANNLFQSVSALGADKDRQKELIEAIPQVSGGSPLYDMIVLAYGHELRGLPLERNALIVISDGVDNRVYGVGTASVVGFKELLRGAEAMNTLVYPIFLDHFTAAPPPRWAKRAKANMEKLAEATGGRLFVAQSVRDLDPVYPQVAEELRSVYTLAYYPEEQEFDGRWRKVQVRVKRDGAKVRTREGYFAK